MSTKEISGAGWHQTPQIEVGSGKSISRPPCYHNGGLQSRSDRPSSITGNVAVRYRTNGGDGYIVGKVLNVGLHRVFFSQVKDSDLLRVLDAWSIAPEVIDLLEQLGVQRVDYYYARTKTLYTADVATIRQRGILKSMHSGIGRRYHVPRAHWQTTRLSYDVPYIEAEVEVTAVPLPRQGSLFGEVVR